MTRLADLHRSVQATLAGKRLGIPVFVRYLWQSQEKPPAVLNRLSVLAALVREWLGQPLYRLYALGSVQAGQVSLTLECRGGATALLCWNASSQRSGNVDLMIVGNHGALYHDGGLDNPWDDGLPWPEEKPEPTLLPLIEQALRTGQPQTAEGGN